MNLRVLSVGAVLAFLGFSATPILADDYYDHNGSKVRLTGVDEHGIVIVYDTPRKGLINQGVTKGVLLFEGSVQLDNSVSGMAYTFKRGCDPERYIVEGEFTNQQDKLQLRGYAPVRAKNSCKVIGYDKTHNSILNFKYLESDEE